MAIEIIPKQREKKKIKISVFDILYYIISILLVLSFLSYLGLIFLIKTSETRLGELGTAIIEKQTKETQELEKRVLATKKKIDTFAILINDHKQTSNMFSFLAETSHKKAFFSDLKLNVESFTADIFGKTEGFKTLGEQVLIFNEENLIKDVALTEVNIGKQGKIEFNLTLLFDSEIFKYKIPEL
ncbi:MAG: hypothetical protein ISS87_01770 [Candidatus Pacebacteria bacterium]|nr:hypothetical protein [Candidatus Paceibacterota bacterium]